MDKVQKRRGTGIWWENPKEKDHLKNLNVDGRIIIKLIFK